MFPVIDPQGRVVAFSGRALTPVEGSEAPRDTPPPKYINSPESPIYTKGATLFGLWQARQAVRQEQGAILVEGNFDVVSLHAHGMQCAVAPLGTAFTSDQARLLRRYATAVTLLFDGDAAGRKAALAAEGPCEEAQLDARVALLPQGSDPDEFVRSKGEQGLRHVISQGKGLPEYLIDVELDEPYSAADSREQAARLGRIQALLARQKDPVARGLLRAYADDRVASRLDLARRAPGAFAALVRQVGAAARAERVEVGPPPSRARVTPRRPGHEERKAIVGAILDFPVLLDDSEIQGALEFLEGDSARIVATVTKCRQVGVDGKKVFDCSEFLAQMPPAIQAFASARLAAPVHDNMEEARITVMANAKKLLGTNVALETRQAVREQEQAAGDWEAAIERAKHVHGLVRERHGVVRR
jgi:DNA primase